MNLLKANRKAPFQLKRIEYLITINLLFDTSQKK